MLYGRSEGSGYRVRVTPVSRRDWTRARAVSPAGDQAPGLEGCKLHAALPQALSVAPHQARANQCQGIRPSPLSCCLPSAAFSLSPGSLPGFPSQDHSGRNLLPSGFSRSQTVMVSGSQPALLREAEEWGT